MQGTELELALARELRVVAAPEELWERIQNPRPAQRRAKSARTASMLACAALLVLAWWVVPRRVEIRSANGGEIRAWVQARTGLNVPLRAQPAGSIQLIGASARRGQAEIAYRVASREGRLTVSRGVAAGRHTNPGNARVFSWSMDGQVYTLTCANPEDLGIACQLCHG